MFQPKFEHASPEHFAEAGIRLHDLIMEIAIRSVKTIKANQAIHMTYLGSSVGATTKELSEART
jgi:hypothetical protein